MKQIKMIKYKITFKSIESTSSQVGNYKKSKQKEAC